VASSSKPVFVYSALASAMIIWGLSFLVIKDVVLRVPMFTLLFLKFSVTAILLGAIGGAS